MRYRRMYLYFISYLERLATMHTIEEQERAAYAAGDTTLAGALAARIDAEDALAGEAPAREELLDAIAHLKGILRDALNDDAWRERAAAAVRA